MRLLAVVVAHELSHNWGVNAGGHVDSVMPSGDVCVMNYFWVAPMNPEDIIWCPACKNTVQSTMNQWPF